MLLPRFSYFLFLFQDGFFAANSVGARTGTSVSFDSCRTIIWINVESRYFAGHYMLAPIGKYRSTFYIVAGMNMLYLLSTVLL